MNRRALLSVGLASLGAALFGRSAKKAEAGLRTPTPAGLYLLRLEPGAEGDQFQGAEAIQVYVLGGNVFRYVMLPGSVEPGAEPILGAQVRVTKVS